MLASFIIVFREVLEAGLIVGIVMAATAGVPRRGRYLWGGLFAGLAGAGLLAALLGELTQMFAGNGQDVFDAAILIFAVLMLAWHAAWMARHGREMATQMRDMGAEVLAGQRTMKAMAVVIAIAILREGSEVALFLYGIATAANLSAASLISGGILGVLAGGAVSWTLYRGLLAIPLRHLFGVTSTLISLLAAGMAGQAAALLANDDYIPALGYQLWNSSRLLSTGSIAGKAAQALLGYSDRPMGIQLLAWIVTLCVLLWLSHRPSKSKHSSAGNLNHA
ncbi:MULTISPECIES: FTR1 family protein [Acidocella]|uniref:FTR1 family iron permease n=1 Tax=Acidocella TaxID=50709 RepID=UPI00028DFDB6|nr:MULTISPECIES: FTR1 family protein [Acidocella]EKM98514.1 iron transporter [Acidocella sp. MX-AZ02]WBO59106.1 FTR1 family protein [Acidocella sp. MX-AZ03]